MKCKKCGKDNISDYEGIDKAVEVKRMVETTEIGKKKTKKGWKRDRQFASKEDHEQAYKKKRKKPYKIYKKKE